MIKNYQHWITCLKKITLEEQSETDTKMISEAALHGFKKDLAIALEALTFRDAGGNMYSPKITNTNKMVIDIAKYFGIEIPKKLSDKKRDEIISKYRKKFKT